MEIESLLRFFSDYGIALVISAIFLAIIVKAMNLVFKFIEKKLNHKTHDDHLEIRDKVSKKVHQLTHEFLSSTKGRRLQVIEFSNSITSVTSLPFRYMTCTYEACPHEISPTARFIDRLPTSLFSHLFDVLQSSKYFEVSRKEAEDEKLISNLLLDLMDKSGGEMFLFTLMKNIKGKPIGLLIFEKDEKFSKSDKESLLGLSKQLTSLLCILDK